MRIRVIPVAKMTPYPRPAAIGMRNLACRDRSISIGVSPPKVVIEVRIIALNLSAPALMIAS